MRALRKEPQHRYSSVEQLVADIRRYLSREPVQARQGNWLYYSQRFVRRHAFGVAAGAAFLVFIDRRSRSRCRSRRSASPTSADRATQDKQRAEQVSEFMLNVFWPPIRSPTTGEETTAACCWIRRRDDIQGDLSQQPEVRARLLEAIGRSYRRMGQPERAVAYLQDALRIQQEAAARRSRRRADRHGTRDRAARPGSHRRVRRYFSEALQISRDSKDQHSEAHAQLLVDLGRLEKLRSNLRQALGHLDQALQLMRDIKGPEDPEVGAILAEMSNIKVWSDDFAGAERAARAAVNIYTIGSDCIRIA